MKIVLSRYALKSFRVHKTFFLRVALMPFQLIKLQYLKENKKKYRICLVRFRISITAWVDSRFLLWYLIALMLYLAAFYSYKCGFYAKKKNSVQLSSMWESFFLAVNSNADEKLPFEILIMFHARLNPLPKYLELFILCWNFTK